MMRFSIIRIQRDDLFEIFFRAGKIPIVLKLNVCARVMRASTSLSSMLNAAAMSCSTFRIASLIGKLMSPIFKETLASRGVGESVTRVQRNRLIEERNRAVEVFFRNLVHVIASLKIEPVRLRVFRITLSDLFLLPAGQTHAQRIGNLPRNLILHGEDVRSLARVMISPKLRVVLRVGQFNPDIQRVALHKNSAGQHRSHVQLPRDVLHLRRLAFVTERLNCAR